MRARTPATAASTTGQQHNFSSGQTLSKHAPSGRTEPSSRAVEQAATPAHPECESERDSNRIIVQTRRVASRHLRTVDDSRRLFRHRHLRVYEASRRSSSHPAGSGHGCGHRNHASTRHLTATRWLRRQSPLECALAGTATGPRRRLGCSSPSTAKAAGRDRRTLEGNQKPKGG